MCFICPYQEMAFFHVTCSSSYTVQGKGDQEYKKAHHMIQTKMPHDAFEIDLLHHTLKVATKSVGVTFYWKE